MKLRAAWLLVISAVPMMTHAQLASFSSADSVCVNTPLTLDNTSTGGSSYYWTFCVSDLDVTPQATNLGNVGGTFDAPAFMDFAEDAGNYYGYVVNNYPGGLVQLNFGNSLLNTPTATFMGNLGGALYNSEEGIQLVQQAGNWYAIIVGGTPPSGGIPSIVTVAFGSNLGNLNPTVTNWGNIGGLGYPTCLKLVQQGGTWYGFTVNATNNTVTRFNFGTSFNNAPTGVNLGNLGGLSQPTGMAVVQNAGNWYLFLVNQTNNTITRFNFGNSLLNTPTGTNLGNPGNALNAPRDMTMIQFCGSTVGFLVNYTDNALVRIDFPYGVASDTLTGVDLGDLGNMAFPQSVSRIFQEGADLYTFVTNVNNNTVTQFEFNSCNSSTIPPSSAFNPPAVTYTTPGTYHISLQMDIGLPSQQSYCKTVVALPYPVFQLPADTSACAGFQLGVNGYPGGVFTWSTGSDSNTTFADTSGKYWVNLSNYGCVASDTVQIALLPTPTVQLPVDTQFCDSGRLIYTSPLPVTYQWSNGSDSNATHVYNNGLYKLTLNDNGCTASDSTQVTIITTPALYLPKDTGYCGSSGFLGYGQANPPGVTYHWSTGDTVSEIGVVFSGLYWEQVDNQGCIATDSTIVTLNPIPVAQLGNDTSICGAQPYILSPGTEPAGYTYTYKWQDGSNQPTYAVSSPGSYSVTVLSNAGCSAFDSVFIAAGQTPIFSLGGKQTICPGETLILRPGVDSLTYSWQNGSTDTVLAVSGPGLYTVTGSNNCGSFTDSVVIVTGLCILRVPNAFTPNGDGINDVFRVLGVDGVDQFDLSIYNRWGQKIFETEDKEAGWDGTFQGIPQPGGAYVYDLRFRYIATKETYVMGGTVVLIR